MFPKDYGIESITLPVEVVYTLLTVLRPNRILLVEDNPADVRLFREAFKDAGELHELHTACDGQDALDFLHRRHEHAHKPRPDLILLDINLPKLSGHDVLKEVKNEQDLMRIPVLMLSNSDCMTDIRKAYDHHANGYIKKPSDLNEYFALVSQVRRFWFHTARLARTPSVTG